MTENKIEKITIEGEILEDVTGMVRKEVDYGAYEEESPHEYYTVGGDSCDSMVNWHEGEYVRVIVVKLPYPKAPLCKHCVQRQFFPTMNSCPWSKEFPKAKRCDQFSEMTLTEDKR